MSRATTITAEPRLPFVDIVREFDAPASAVFRAHTDPKLFARWNGPREITLNLHEYDATPGGRWRYTIPHEGGMEFGFHGIFHTVEPDALIVQTFEFSMAPGQVGVSMISFEEREGRTRLSIHEVYPSVETRDAAVASGMEYGIREGYERLDEVLAG
jgi:uncharacterized protein YndB with AHSA1/START domain